jgi:hypothetical protein
MNGQGRPARREAAAPCRGACPRSNSGIVQLAEHVHDAEIEIGEGPEPPPSAGFS